MFPQFSYGNDTTSRFCMMIDAYENLQRLSPDHKLLKLVNLNGRIEFTEEFQKKYNINDVWFSATYAEDLRKEAKNISSRT